MKKPSKKKLVIILLFIMINLHGDKYKFENLILYANREFPIGFINFYIYSDSTYSINYSTFGIKAPEYFGRIIPTDDTLFLHQTHPDNTIVDTAFIDSDNLTWKSGGTTEHLTIYYNNTDLFTSSKDK